MHPCSRQAPATIDPVRVDGRGFTSILQSARSQRSLLASVVTLAFTLSLLGGCTKESGGLLDPSGVPPLLKSAAVFPDTIRMKTLPQSNGVLTVTIRAEARIVRQSGSRDIAGVSAQIIASGQVEPFLTVALHDDGLASDSLAGDGVFSAAVQFKVPRSTSGVYRLRFVATDLQGAASNAVESPLFMVRDSHAPVLSNLVAPDSVLVPAGGSIPIPIYIRATDVDGQADINQVYFLSLDSSDPTRRFIMLNDGSAPGSVAGDSTYAIVVQAAESPTLRKTYRFAFQAVNNFGDTSATILHSLTIH